MKARTIGIVLLVLFVIFLIATDATAAGQAARSFFSWIGDGFGQLLDFLNSLFADTPESSETAPLG